MESTSLDRNFGNNRQHNKNNANSNRNPVYNANYATVPGINNIKFEPVPCNFIQFTSELESPRHMSSNMLSLYQMPVPLEYQLPKPERKLKFTPVPNNVALNISHQANRNTNCDKLRDKYEILKGQLDTLNNSMINRPNELFGSLSNNNQAADIPNPNHIPAVPQRKYKYSLKSRTINKSKYFSPHENESYWDGHTEYYTSSTHQVKCQNCQELRLKCYTSKLYGANREFNAFIAILKESGFIISFPENKYLAVTDQDKTKIIDNDKKREAYYTCTIRSNITINKYRFKSKCTKCNVQVDVSQGISLASCHHVFCNNCMKSHILSSVLPVMKCPDSRCVHKLVENEIRAFMSEIEFQSHLQRVEASGKFKLNNEYQRKNSKILPPVIIAGSTISMWTRTKNIIFKCKVDKCSGYLQIQSNETIHFMVCPICSTINCGKCEVIHTNLTCREYQLAKRGAYTVGLKTTDYNDDKWVCCNCTFIHKEKMNRCQICFTQRVAIQLVEDVEYNGSADTDDIKLITSIDGNQYEDLLELNAIDIIRNTTQFQCIICFDEVDVGKGVKLHDCSHEFCENCLTDWIKASGQASTTCPFREKDFVCEGTIQHREMEYLVDDVFQKYLYRSVLQAQKDLKNCFQCKTSDCRGMWEYEDNVAAYQCPLCGQVNCHQCNAVHGTISCRVYQQKVYDESIRIAIKDSFLIFVFILIWVVLFKAFI